VRVTALVCFNPHRRGGYHFVNRLFRQIAVLLPQPMISRFQRVPLRNQGGQVGFQGIVNHIDNGGLAPAAAIFQTRQLKHKPLRVLSRSIREKVVGNLTG
jgi:hypothetical protein